MLFGILWSLSGSLAGVSLTIFGAAITISLTLDDIAKRYFMSINHNS